MLRKKEIIRNDRKELAEEILAAAWSKVERLGFMVGYANGSVRIHITPSKLKLYGLDT